MYDSKEKIRAYANKWYHKNKTRIAENRKRARKQYYEKIMAWLHTLKNKPCTICGGQFPPECMDFHHKNPKEKDGNIGAFLRRSSKSKALKEIKKCDLVCANCHRTIHHKRQDKTDIPEELT